MKNFYSQRFGTINGKRCMVLGESIVKDDQNWDEGSHTIEDTIVGFVDRDSPDDWELIFKLEKAVESGEVIVRGRSTLYKWLKKETSKRKESEFYLKINGERVFELSKNLIEVDWRKYKKKKDELFNEYSRLKELDTSISSSHLKMFRVFSGDPSASEINEENELKIHNDSLHEHDALLLRLGDPLNIKNFIIYTP